MNYYVHRRGEVLEHALRERGAERANHKYYARVNVGGRFRYFYTPQELAAYRSGKKVGRAKAEGQASDTNRSKNSSAIKVIRKDGSSQSVKPIKTSRTPRDSKDIGFRIVNDLFKKKRKKKKNTVHVKPISEKPVKKPEQEDTLTVTRSNGKTTSVKPTKAPVKRKRKRKPSLTVTRKNQNGDKS